MAKKEAKKRYEEARKERYKEYRALVKERDSITDEIRKIAIDKTIDIKYSKERDALNKKKQWQSKK